MNNVSKWVIPFKYRKAYCSISQNNSKYNRFFQIVVPCGRCSCTFDPFLSLSNTHTRTHTHSNPFFKKPVEKQMYTATLQYNSN